MHELLEHYRPGLDASFLDDDKFIYKTACLLKIREMEQDEKVTQIFKNFFGG